MEKLSLELMFRTMKIENNKEMITKIIDKIEPSIRIELESYLKNRGNI